VSTVVRITSICPFPKMLPEHALGIGLAGHPISIRVEVVGIARVALELRLGFLLGSEVGAVKLPVSAPSSATSKLLARDAIVIRIEPVGVAGISLQHGLGFFLRGEVDTV
jgi:hypothetical protein